MKKIKYLAVALTMGLSSIANAAVLDAKTLVAQSAQLSNFAAASNATTGHQISCHSGDSDDNRQILFVEKISAGCGYGKSVTFTGAGIGLRATSDTYFEISCLAGTDPSGDYYGVKATAVIELGLDIAVFVGSHGVCFVAGTEVMGIGAGVTGMQMTLAGFGASN
jgi:hypothetical protein